jgi:hypothetical protein
LRPRLHHLINQGNKNERFYRGACVSLRIIKARLLEDNGTEVTANVGDAYYFALGHDGWVVGDKPFIGYEFHQDSKDFGVWKIAD